MVARGENFCERESEAPAVVSLISHIQTPISIRSCHAALLDHRKQVDHDARPPRVEAIHTHAKRMRAKTTHHMNPRASHKSSCDPPRLREMNIAPDSLRDFPLPLAPASRGAWAISRVDGHPERHCCQLTRESPSGISAIRTKWVRYLTSNDAPEATAGQLWASGGVRMQVHPCRAPDPI